MCLITFQKKALIAESDFSVAKCLIKTSKGLCSPHYDFIWEKGILYQENIIAKKIILKDIRLSEYAYFDNISNYYYSSFPDFSIVRVVSKGFHSAENIERLIGTFHDIYEFTIPKGSLYFKDDTGLIVSNQIIFKNQ